MSRFLSLFFVVASVTNCQIFSSEIPPKTSTCSRLPKERLSLLRNDSIFVYSTNDRVWLITVKEKTAHNCQLRVIEATKDTLEREGYTSWCEWYKQGFFSSLSSTDVDINSLLGESIDSVETEESKSAQLTLTYFLTTFFSGKANVRQLNDDQKRKIGPAPHAGEIDLRKIWLPPLPTIHDMHTHLDKKNFRIDTFEIEWPYDGTDIQGKSILTYYITFFIGDTQKESPLSSLPIWIESKGRTLFTFRLIEYK